MCFMDQRILRNDREGSIGIRDQLEGIKYGELAEAVVFVAQRDLVVFTDGVIQPAHARIVILGIRLRISYGRIGACRYWASEAELCGGAQGCSGSWIDSQHGCHTRVEFSPSRQEVSDVRLTDYVRTAKNKIAKCGALIPGEEKCLVVDNRPANRTAILIALDLVVSGRRRKKVLRIESRIADKFESVSVEVVGARFCDDVYHAARILSVFRAVVAGLHTEFL